MKKIVKLILFPFLLGFVLSCGNESDDDSTNDDDVTTTDDDDGTVSEDYVSTTLDYSEYETYGDALADQILAGDGAGIDNTFRNSGVVIDESDNTYYAVNGVHPVINDDYSSYYPKSIVKASLDTDEIVEVYSFSTLNGHDTDMEGLTFGPEEDYLYVGDEYNYIYKLNLTTSEVEIEWDLADIGISTDVDRGIEAIGYSSITGNFYVGIQDSSTVYEIVLGDDGSIAQVSEISIPSSPSGLFAHSDGTLYVLTFDAIYRYESDGTEICEVTIPEGLGMTRPDGIYIDSNDEYLYLADSQGPLYDGYSMYKIAWTQPCD